MSIKQLSPESQPIWYVAYTFPKAEKKVQSKLEKIGIHSYLPLHEVVRDWSDRRKRLVVPLFPNYIFINVLNNRRHEIFAVKEVIRYVCFDGKPAVINDSIVNSLKIILKESTEVNIEGLIKNGTTVRIVRGPFIGLEGVIISQNGRTRLTVQINALQRSVGVNIPASDIAPARATMQLEYSND